MGRNGSPPLTRPRQIRRMTLKSIMRIIGWSILFGLPPLLAVAGVYGAGRLGCAAEARVLSARQQGSQPGLICAIINDPPASYADQASSKRNAGVSDVELAALKVSTLAAVATFFLGAIATLLGYQSFMKDGGRRRGLSIGFGIDMRADGRGGVAGTISNASSGGITILETEVSDGSSPAFQTLPEFRVRGGGRHEWTVLLPHSAWPTSSIFRGRYKLDAGGTFRFEAVFDAGAGDWRMTRLLSERI